MSIKSIVIISAVSISALLVPKKDSATLFTHALIYRYETPTEKGEFWLYHNLETCSVLYVPEDEMIDAVIADTLGNYHFYGDDGHGEKTVTKQYIDWVSEKIDISNQVLPKSDHLLTFEDISEKRFIRNPVNHQTEIECKGYKMLYNKTIRQQHIYFTESIPINSYQIYGFNRLEGDIKLPVPQLDMIGILSKKQLLTHIESDVFKMELVAYEYNPYWFDTERYR